MKSYFPHDSNARNSSELTQVRMKHKAAGYGVYFMLLERLRDEENYMSIKDYNMLAFDLREDASLIKSVIEEFGLFVFTEDGKYFYSEGFKKRMEIKDEKSRKLSEAGKKGAMKKWGNKNDGDDIATIEEKDSHPIATPRKKDGNKSKVKKSKVNNNTLKEIKKEKFVIPTVEEVELFCKENDLDIDSEYFINYYNSNGWCVGRQKMKDWKATARNWDRRANPNKKKKPLIEETEMSKEQRQAILDEIEEQKKQLGGSK